MTLTPQRVFAASKPARHTVEAPRDEVWVGAGTNWYTPYPDVVGEQAVALYRDHVDNPDSRRGAWVRANLYLLRHKNLVCADPLGQPSYADVLLELANGEAGKLEPHPLAERLPLMVGKEWEDFRADIAANGINQKIILKDGKILDGRNRQRASDETGQVAAYAEFDGDDVAAEKFVHSENFARRHLTTRQKALYAAARSAKPVGSNQYGSKGAGAGAASTNASTDAADPSTSHSPSKTGVNALVARDGSATKEKPAQNCAPSQAQAAADIGVSRRSVQHAAAVLDKGTPALKRALERGDVPLAAAAALASLPPAKQDRIVNAAERADLNAASVLRASRLEDHREKRLAPMRDLPAGQFAIIDADPGWKFKVWSEETGEERSPQYTTEELEDIFALPVGAIAAPNAILQLWVTAPFAFHVPEGETRTVPFIIADRWGRPDGQGGRIPWRLRSHYVWDKVTLGKGLGFNRVVHEFVMIFTQGDVPMPLPSDRVASCYREQRSSVHSQKTTRFRELLDLQYEGTPKIVLYHRGLVPEGWAGWGNQAEVPDAPADDWSADVRPPFLRAREAERVADGPAEMEEIPAFLKRPPETPPNGGAA